MFFYFAAAERDRNCIRGFLLAEYAVELAQLLGERGLQGRFRAWHRGTPPFKVGWQRRRRAGRHGTGRRSAPLRRA